MGSVGAVGRPGPSPDPPTAGLGSPRVGVMASLEGVAVRVPSGLSSASRQISRLVGRLNHDRRDGTATVRLQLARQLPEIHSNRRSN